MGVLTKALTYSRAGEFWPQDQQFVSVAQAAQAVTVNADTAFGLPAFFASVRVLSEDIAKLPLIVYKRLPNGGKDRAPDHSLYPVLHTAPNPEMTSFIWRETGMGHLLTWGNFYSEIVRNRLGQVVQLWPLRPDRVTVKRNDAGARIYRVRDGKGGWTDLPASKVLHIPGLGFDGTVGYSVISLMSKAISLGLSAQAFAEAFWRNGAKPGGVLQVPQDLHLSDTAIDRLRDQFATSHEGLSNAQRFAILQDGITFTQIGLPLGDSQFVETRKFQVEETARGMRIPPHKIGALDRSTNNNIEHQAIEYVQDSLGVWCARFEQQYAKDLFDGGDPFFAEHLLDAQMRGDALSRAQTFAIWRQNGILNGDGWRAIENMNPIEDGSGKDYWRPANYVIAGEPAAPGIPAQPPNPSDPTAPGGTP